jgi:CubicO group peptidase (beta-lactamase class C family)
MERSTPSAEGVAPGAIAAFVDVLEGESGIEPHGLIIQRHGVRIAEGYWAPHTAARSRLVYSLSKSFTGTALGLQLGEGRLTLDDLVVDHLPELAEGADERTRRMRIRHIASMASGHRGETIVDAMTLDPDDPDRGFLSIPPPEEPGSCFAYNQPPVAVLARILQRLAGERLVDYLRPRIFDPLGIGEFRWQRSRPGFDIGYSGVHTNLDAVARLGQLYLADGVWEGRRLLPEGWVAMASSCQTDNSGRGEDPDWEQGYGFQFWMSQHGYRGDGAFGQYMVVLPELDAVVALFSCTERMQTVLDAMWELLVPAMVERPLPPSPADDRLTGKLAELVQPTASQRLGGDEPAVPARVFTRRPGALSHPTVTGVEATGSHVIISEEDSALRIPLTAGWAPVDDSTAASATSLGDGTVIVDVQFLATPHRLELHLDPDTGTFAARWPLMPILRGDAGRLVSMRAPVD